MSWFTVLRTYLHQELKYTDLSHRPSSARHAVPRVDGQPVSGERLCLFLIGPYLFGNLQHDVSRALGEGW